MVVFSRQAGRVVVMSRQGTSYGGAYAMPDGEVAEAHHQSDPRVCVAHVPPASRPADTNAPLAGRGHQAYTKPAPSLPQAYAPPTRRGQQACAKAFPHPRAADRPQSGQMRPAGARRLPRVCAPCGARTPCTDFVRQDKRDVAPLGDTATRAAGSLPADLRQLHTGAWLPGSIRVRYLDVIRLRP